MLLTLQFNVLACPRETAGCPVPPEPCELRNRLTKTFLFVQSNFHPYVIPFRVWGLSR